MHIKNTIQEKTTLQGALDSHYYGETLSYVNIGGLSHALVSNDTDNLIAIFPLNHTKVENNFENFVDTLVLIPISESKENLIFMMDWWMLY